LAQQPKKEKKYEQQQEKKLGENEVKVLGN
jgi:hypothetical protein